MTQEETHCHSCGAEFDKAGNHVQPPELWGLQDARGAWVDLHDFNKHLPGNGPVIFFSKQAAEDFRESTMHSSFHVEPITREAWELSHPD